MNQSTICAISTPAGRGGIAVCRVSGPDAIAVADRIWRGRSLAEAPANTARYGEIVDLANDGRVLDHGVAIVFRAPHSYTGEDTVELSVHGSVYIQRQLLASLLCAGARMAEPGEFTRRAFANGKMDLAEAEAVADLIASESRSAHRLALNQMKGTVSSRLSNLRDKLLEIASLLELELDFSEEDVEFASRATLRSLAEEISAEISRLHNSFSTGNAIKNGIPVAIVGATNVGKSSLLNRLLDEDRAIVSDIHGTTRDIVEDTAIIDGYTVRFIDTAGIRQTDDTVEALGIRRSYEAIRRARVVILVVDAADEGAIEILSRKTNGDILPDGVSEGAVMSLDVAIGNLDADARLVVAINKTDIADASTARQRVQPLIDRLVERGIEVDVLDISAATGRGIDELRNSIISAVAAGDSSDDVIITNARHAEALRAASESVQAVIAGLDNTLPGDLIAQDLRQTLAHLASITGGEITTPEILSTIFSRFCIGK